MKSISIMIIALVVLLIVPASADMVAPDWMSYGISIELLKIVEDVLDMAPDIAIIKIQTISDQQYYNDCWNAEDIYEWINVNLPRQ